MIRKSTKTPLITHMIDNKKFFGNITQYWNMILYDLEENIALFFIPNFYFILKYKYVYEIN